jgi:hypothetical protein
VEKLISACNENNIKFVITLHEVRKKDFDFTQQIRNLKDADRVIFLSQSDFEHGSQTLPKSESFRLPIKSYRKRDKKILKEKLKLPFIETLLLDFSFTSITSSPDSLSILYNS